LQGGRQAVDVGDDELVQFFATESDAVFLDAFLEAGAQGNVVQFEVVVVLLQLIDIVAGHFERDDGFADFAVQFAFVVHGR
jgi:hypothetical protein